MRPAAVASALTYATNHGVSMLFLCSTVPSEHWLSRLSEISKEGVKMIEVKYLCNACAARGVNGICVHGELQLPAHIDTSAEEDLVKQAMDLVMPGSYQLEVCGSNLHTATTSTAAFDTSKIDEIQFENVDADSMEALYIALDPVQAGTGLSGIGLAVVGRANDSFVVSILAFLLSNMCFNAENEFTGGLSAFETQGNVPETALIAPSRLPRT